MAEKNTKEEKFYTPEEVAVAILKKTEELLKKSGLFKANTSHEIETGEEPNNDDAEAPEYLANADIEDSGAHGEKKSKKTKPGAEMADEDGDGDVDGSDAMEMADKDKDGDIDGEDAIEAKEEESGEDLDEDKEADEPEEHKEKVEEASEEKEEDKDEKKDDKKKPAFAKSEECKSEDCAPKIDLKKPSLKKFIMKRKMKKSGAPTADARAAEKLSGAPKIPSPAQKIKEQPKLQMEKNKSVENLLGIKPKAGK